LQALEVISMSRPPLSIIIPTYNALPRLQDCLTALVGGLGASLVREAIVVDGGSQDESANLAADMGCRVLTLSAADRGRGAQLQTGAKVATGEWLLFLHGDTVLQEGWVSAVATHLVSTADKAGYFRLGFDRTGAGPSRVAALANLRSQVWGLPYGDQGLLISRVLYDQIGGYQAIALMEDVALVRQLRGKLSQLNALATTSGAKFERGGWWAVPVRNLSLLAAYILGVGPETLAKWYR
jgi:rSAM/selenodomain-associated transferase 2